MTEPERDPRVYLAAERTFLAWIRTGIALMGFGFVVARFGLFLREVSAIAAKAPERTPGFSLWAGTGLVIMGVIVIGGSTAEYAQKLRGFREGREITGRPSAGAVALGAVLVIAGAGMAAYLLLFR
jgi:putative membrane protein